MKKPMLVASLVLTSLLSLALPAQADWSVTEASRIGFVSIKNSRIGENNAFERISGGISDAGEVSISIDLASVETGVGIRNERLQKMLFDVAIFPTATITATLSETQLAVLEAGGSVAGQVTVSVTLHGQTISRPIELSASASDETLRVVSTQPIVISAAAFGLESGVAALQKIAGLSAISRAIPVTVDLSLQRN